MDEAPERRSKEEEERLAVLEMEEAQRVIARLVGGALDGTPFRRKNGSGSGSGSGTSPDPPHEERTRRLRARAEDGREREHWRTDPEPNGSRDGS
jgi:hypothetical protein